MRLKPYITSWKRKMKFISADKQRVSIPLIGLLIYLSTVPMQLSNYVLCIGTDGHVAFEVSANGRCTDTHALESEHAEPVITGTTSDEGHCGSCIDLAIFLPLKSETVLVPVQDALTPSAPVVAFITHQVSASTVLTHTSLLDPLVVDHTLVSLRTTTLLI